MASAASPFVSSKETTNYARLCRLLVDVGSQALRDTFDKIHPPATLYAVLSSASVHATLQSLYKGRRKVLNPTQWGKLYPAVPTTVSSASFDITLLTVLLRNICSLSPPVAGWDSLPLPADTSIADDIARVKYYRNNVYGHASQASVDDTSFSTYWPEIREALVRLGGPSFRTYIDNLEHDCMDPDIEEHYRELMKQWKTDDDSIKDKLEEMEENIRESLKHTRSEMKEIKESLDTLTASLENEDKENIRDSLEQTRSEVKEMKDRLDTLTAQLEENKYEEPIRDELNKMKSEIGNISDKLDALTASRQPTKDEGSFDPSEIIDEIRQLYKSREGWLSPFPWCEEFHFRLDDIFTRLKVISKKKTRGRATGEVVNMSTIFKPHDECSMPRTVLIEGKPGMGKTTYCKKLVYDWATGKQEAESCFPRFETVLLLKCRDIKSNLWEAIDDQLLPRDIQDDIREKFFSFIRHNQSKALLVLDGLDELPARKLPEFSEIIQGRVLSKCHLVVTSRHEAGIEVSKYCDTLLEIEGFTKQDAREFINKYFKTMANLALKLLFKLKDDQNLRDLAANPLNTALLCLVCEEFQGIFPESRTELYLSMTECILRRYRKKKGLSETCREKLTEVYKAQLKHLGWIALDRLHEENLDLKENELGKHASDLSGFGFLSMQPGGSKLRPCQRYSFLHKSFQEFFAAHYLSCQLLNEEITPDSLVSDIRYFNELKQVLLFSCGIVAAQCKKTAVALIASLTRQVNRYGCNRLPAVLDCITECIRAKSDIGVTVAQVLGSCLNLQSISLMDLECAHAAPFAEAIKVNTTLARVILHGIEIGDAGASTLAEAIKVNTTLTQLTILVTNIGDAGASTIAEAIKVNTTLTYLSLDGNNIGDAGASSLAEAIKVNKTLTQLTILVTNIGDAGASTIAEAIKVNTTLTYLSLDGNNIGDAGASSLAEAIKVNTTLARVILHGIEIGDAGASTLAEAIKVNTALTYFRLSSFNIGDAGASSLAEAIKVNTTLTQLIISVTNIGDAGASTIAEAIKVNTTLTYLSFDDNNIGDAGASSLAEAIKVNKTLRVLSLTRNNIGDAGASAIAEAIKVTTTMTWFSLGGKNIGDAGASSLAEAIKVNTTLTCLSLEGKNIGDAGAFSLAEAIKVNTTLTDFKLKMNDSGDAGVGVIRR